MRALALLVLACVGCGPAGDVPYGAWSRREAETGAYALRLPIPPWEQDEEGSGGDRLRFEVPVSDARAARGAPPKLTLEVAPASGAARARAEADARGGGSRLVGPRAFATLDGVEGWETIRFDEADARWLRVAYLPLRGGVLRLAIEGSPELEDPEVDALIEAVEVFE